MEWKQSNYRISTEKRELNIDVIHQYLTQSYWAEGIKKELVVKSISGSLCFGLYDKNRQIGFARVVTDKATFAHLMDVFIIDGYQAKGLGKWLLKCIRECDDLQGLRRFTLGTHDAHGFYEQFGFSEVSSPEKRMEIVVESPYLEEAEAVS